MSALIRTLRCHMFHEYWTNFWILTFSFLLRFLFALNMRQFLWILLWRVRINRWHETECPIWRSEHSFNRDHKIVAPCICDFGITFRHREINFPRWRNLFYIGNKLTPRRFEMKEAIERPFSSKTSDRAITKGSLFAGSFISYKLLRMKLSRELTRWLNWMATLVSVVSVNSARQMGAGQLEAINNFGLVWIRLLALSTNIYHVSVIAKYISNVKHNRNYSKAKQ